MQTTEEKIIAQLRAETKFSGVDFYPVDIKDIQESITVDDVTMHNAVSALIAKGIIEFKAIDNSMIQFTLKGKLVA